jgi:hypothetical protein
MASRDLQKYPFLVVTWAIAQKARRFSYSCLFRGRCLALGVSVTLLCVGIGPFMIISDSRSYVTVNFPAIGSLAPCPTPVCRTSLAWIVLPRAYLRVIAARMRALNDKAISHWGGEAYLIIFNFIFYLQSVPIHSINVV